MLKNSSKSREEIDKIIKEKDEELKKELAEIRKRELENEAGFAHRQRYRIPESARGMYGWD